MSFVLGPDKEIPSGSNFLVYISGMTRQTPLSLDHMAPLACKDTQPLLNTHTHTHGLLVTHNTNSKSTSVSPHFLPIGSHLCPDHIPPFNTVQPLFSIDTFQDSKLPD